MIGRHLNVVYNPARKQESDDNRYAARVQFCRINLSDGAMEKIQLPESYNVSCLEISKDENWVFFVHMEDKNSACWLGIPFTTQTCLFLQYNAGPH